MAARKGQMGNQLHALCNRGGCAPMKFHKIRWILSENCCGRLASHDLEV